MQDELGGAALRIGLERDLRLHHFQEKLLFALGEDLYLRLAGDLLVEPVVFTGDGDEERGRKLVPAYVAFQDLGIDRDCRAFLDGCAGCLLYTS